MIMVVLYWVGLCTYVYTLIKRTYSMFLFVIVVDDIAISLHRVGGLDKGGEMCKSVCGYSSHFY